jgi:hypothetical protein
MSKGAEKIKALLFELYGKATHIVEEHQVGYKLRLDYYIPSLGFAVEYHGRQHEEFVSHFHGDAEGFDDAKRRDRKKIELCAEQNIALVVVWYHETLTVELLKSKINEALDSFVPVEAPPPKRDEYRERRLAKAKEARKEQYKWKRERLKQFRSK